MPAHRRRRHPPPTYHHSPAVEAATYRPGDTVHINVVITENDELHLVGLNIFDQQTGLHAWESFIHRHTQRLDVVDFFLPPGQDSTTYQLRVAALDHHGNESLEISYFHIAPL
jgi:hypothetical protein